MPTGKQQIIYWDTCVFLAWMKDETRPPGDMEGIAEVAKLVMADQVILITSILTRAEILEGKLKPGVIEKYDELMHRSNVVPQNLDPPVARLTSKIRDFYRTTDFELLIPDAIHLATAIHYNTDEFQTFDGVKPKKPRDKRYARSGLLLLDGNVAGHELKIRKPSAAQYELKLKPAEEKPGVKEDERAGTNTALESAKGHEREADPAHSAPVQRSDSGRAQGEAAGEIDDFAKSSYRKIKIKREEETKPEEGG